MELLDIKGIGKVTLDKLNSLGVTCLEDLISYIPASYIDMSMFSDVTKCNNGEFCLFTGHVHLKSKSSNYKAKYIKAKIICEGTVLNAIWFNQHYIYDKLDTLENYTFFGKISKTNNIITISNPLFELSGHESKLKGILPIYRTGGLIPQANLRKYIELALDNIEIASLINNNRHMELIKNCHNPYTIKEAQEAQDKLIIYEIATLILGYRISRINRVDNKLRKYSNLDISEVISQLDYKLTTSQLQATQEIIEDMCSPIPMNRLLMGDVGSGKTIVALLAAYIAIKNGYQVAILVPTTILAEQHYKNAKILEDIGINTLLLSSRMTNVERKYSYNSIESDEAKLIIGTQSIINENITYKNLGLIITDESHRFGVCEKRTIEEKGLATDTLTMTATPIPRTLSLTMFDDLSISKLDVRKKCNIDTHIVPNSKIKDMYNLVIDEISKGRQCYIVCPRIEDSEGVELTSAIGLYNSLYTGVLKNYKVALLHGKQLDNEKTSIMNSFSAKEIDVLVSTTVIEVGIDVPNSTVMIVMNAERYGLATLNQLRGRVGRGEHKSYCLLCTDNLANERLRILKNTNDGFKIAEMDYELRGGGDFIGIRQSGASFIDKFACPVTRNMIAKGKQLADSIPINDELIENYQLFQSKQMKKIVQSVTMN